MAARPQLCSRLGEEYLVVRAPPIVLDSPIEDVTQLHHN